MTTKTLPSGLMIQDQSDMPMQAKIADVCQHYHKRFGRWPKTVWVNDNPDGFTPPGGLTVTVSPFLRKGYFLVGPLPEIREVTK